MARVWQSGFELNSLTTDVEFSTVSGTAAISTTTVRSGSYALRVNPAASTGFVRFHAFTANQTTVAYQRFYLYIASLPSANTYITKLADNLNNQVAGIILTTAGKLRLITAGSTQVGSDSPALNTGQWYRIELKVDATTNPGSLDAQIDGVSFASGANSAQGSWARLLVGVITTNATADLFFDDWCLNDSTGSSQNSWPGPGKIVHLVPNGDGDNHAWLDTAAAAGTANNYQLVREVPPDDSTSFVQSVTLNAEDNYNLTDPPVTSIDTVNVVMAGVRYTNNTADATTAFKVQIKKTSGGTVTQSAALIPNSTSWFTNANAQPRLYPITLYADPDGAVWTAVTLASMQAGVKVTAAGTNRVRATSVWVSVDYTPATQASSGDTATGVESAALTATATAADTAHGTDTATLTAANSNADTVTATDTATMTATAAGQDTGQTAEAATVTAVLVAADIASAADSEHLTVAVADSDAAATSDQVPQRTIADDDLSMAVDSPILTDLAALDAATATDETSVAASLAAADLATAAETTAPIGLSGLDFMAVVEAVQAASATLIASDAATIVEVAETYAALAVADAATATEAATAAIQIDVTVTAGPPARGWAAGEPERAWRAGEPHT